MITATLSVGGVEHGIIDATVTTSQFNEAAELEATVPERVAVAEGDTASLDINGTTVFTGTVEDRTTTGRREIQLRARDAITDLKRASVTQTFDRAQPATIVREAASAAGVSVAATTLPDERLTPQYNDDSAAFVVQDVARLADAVWYLTPENELVVTTDPAPTEHTLTKLKPETSVGLYETPYTKVRVYVASPASSTASGRTGGEEATRLINSRPSVAEAGDDDGATYVARPASVKTYAQAKNYALSLLREFREQQGEGRFVALGDASIRPFDVVTAPPLANTADYVVSAVEHTVSNSEGFLTRIQPGRVV